MSKKREYLNFSLRFQNPENFHRKMTSRAEDIEMKNATSNLPFGIFPNSKILLPKFFALSSTSTLVKTSHFLLFSVALNFRQTFSSTSSICVISQPCVATFNVPSPKYQVRHNILLATRPPTSFHKRASQLSRRIETARVEKALLPRGALCEVNTTTPSFHVSSLRPLDFENSPRYLRIVESKPNF